MYKLHLVPLEWKDKEFQDFSRRAINDQNLKDFNFDANKILRPMVEYNLLKYNYYGLDLKDSGKCKLKPVGSYSDGFKSSKWMDESLIKGRIVFPSNLEELIELVGNKNLTRKKIEINHPDGLITGNLVREKGLINSNYYFERTD